MGCVLSSLPRRSSSPLNLNQSRSLEHPNGPENSASPKHVNDHEHSNTSSRALSPTNLKSNIQAQAPRKESAVTTSTILSAHISPAQQQHISTLIQSLLYSLQTYDSLITTTNSQPLYAIDALLNSLPNHILISNFSTDSSPCTAPKNEVSVNVRIKLQDLHTLQMEKSSLITTYFKPLHQNLENKWTSFCELKPEEQREMAWGESLLCLPIQMFRLLGNVRAGCVEVMKVEDKIARWIGREYDVVLELLKIIETEFGIGDMGGGGNNRGQGTGAAMQWRVFEMLESKRREELKGVEERVLECRMRVSGELVDIIEGLKEEF
jgi:hypothetical protein